VYIHRPAAAHLYDAPVTETRTSYLVGRADRVLRAELEQFLEGSDLTLNELTTLSVLAARPGLSNARLARRSLVSPQAMHKVISHLESSGLVERTGSPAGGRALETTVTAKGRAALTLAEAQMTAAEAVFLEPLDADERRRFRDLLLKIARLDVEAPDHLD
jgi:DNA-binding MarR family transcriptional regulator